MPPNLQQHELLHDRLTTSTKHTTIDVKSTASSVTRNQFDEVLSRILVEALAIDQCSNQSAPAPTERPESHGLAAGKPALRQQKSHQTSL